MGLAVLERLKIEQRSDEEIVIKTVTNGNLKVQNVPFVMVMVLVVKKNIYQLMLCINCPKCFDIC